MNSFASTLAAYNARLYASLTVLGYALSDDQRRILDEAVDAATRADLGQATPGQLARVDQLFAEMAAGQADLDALVEEVRAL